MVTKTYGREVLKQLEFSGKKVPLETSWQEIPAGMVAIFCRKPFEGCLAVNFAIAYGETAFENFKKQETEAIFISFPRELPLFLQEIEESKEEKPVIVSRPAKPSKRKKSTFGYRNLSMIF